MKYQKYLKYIDENINQIPKNATILLSGGSGGLGSSFLHYLVYLNLNVILLLRNVELGNKIKQEVKSKFKDSTSNIEIIYFDYLDLDSINNALKILKTKKIDYFVSITVYRLMMWSRAILVISYWYSGVLWKVSTSAVRYPR